MRSKDAAGLQKGKLFLHPVRLDVYRLRDDDEGQPHRLDVKRDRWYS